MLTPCLSYYVNDSVKKSFKHFFVNAGKTHKPVDDSSVVHTTVVVNFIQFALGDGLGWS